MSAPAPDAAASLPLASAGPLPCRIPLSIATARLVLRFPREDDWRALHAYFGDEDSVRFTTRRAFTEAETWRAVAGMAGHWALRGYGPYVITDRARGEVLGVCGPWYPNDWPEPEIKWSLVPAARGQGIAREAAEAVLAMLHVHLSWTPISLILADNARSIALARALGAGHESSLEFRGSRAQVFRHRSPPRSSAVRRLATGADAEHVARLFVDTQVRHLTFLPPPPIEKVAPMMRDEVLPAGRTWVLEASDSGELLAMLSLAPADAEVHLIERLYVAADRVGTGLGSELLAFALAPEQRRGRLVRLWTFQANAGARRFYERQGFVPVRFTDGRDNIERCPDVLYELA
ncbi:MAG: GNAT family N-acetyltransferase [Burkholderiaceae bacterium]|nr:GNAT family N-acetyltransferase [Burkholderiaceae bacterium]